MKTTLAQVCIPKTTFYRWYDRHQAFGTARLEDRRPNPRRAWNRIADDVREEVVKLAFDAFGLQITHARKPEEIDEPMFRRSRWKP